VEFQKEKTMKHVLIAVAFISLSSIPSLAKSKAEAKAPMSDQQFVNFAAQTDMTETNIAQLAQTDGRAQPVKDYAKSLISDRTGDYHELFDAARTASLTVPDAIDAQHNKEDIGPIQNPKGSAFDHRYIQEIVDWDASAVTVFKHEANDGKNRALKTYAERALPTLEKRLADAKSLLKSKT
jgi:putative membrane protein